MNNVQTTLFVSLIVTMILPFGSMNYAQAEIDRIEKYEAIEVTDAIQQITPYVFLDETGLVKFYIEPKEIPLDSHVILIAVEYIEIQNSFRSQAQNDPNEKPTIDEKLSDKFFKFIEDIKDKKEKSRETTTSISVLNFILPEAFAWGEICGGAPWNPQHEPSVYHLYNSLGAENYLRVNGYHEVLAYATSYGHHGNDFAKEIDAFGCDRGELRKQGLVTGTYTYNSQSPEPNPEITSYTAPVWWWDGYVYAWHIAN